MVGLWYVKCQDLVNALVSILVFQEVITVRIHQEEYRCHFDKCHINPASGRVFCYNISIERKKFPPMKNLATIALALLVTRQVVLKDNKKGERCGRVRNMEMYKIPNNGGL